MNIPNALTLLRMFLVPVFLLMLILNFPWHYFIALVIFVAASITDMLDGRIARKKNLITDTGKFLDPIADKMLTTAAFIGFLYLGIGSGMIWIILIILFREFLVSSMRMIAAKNGKVIAADMFGKVKTVVQMVAIIMTIASKWIYTDILSVLFSSSGWLVITGTVIDIVCASALWICAVLTILSGINYLVKNKDSIGLF